MRKSALESAGKIFSRKGISDRVLDIMVSPIKEMRIIAQDYDNVISFGQGIPYLDTPEEIRKRLSGLLMEKDISKYTISPGLPELRARVANRLWKIGVSANPENEILITAGAMEGIFCAVMTLVNPDDEVILFTPGFSSHIEQVRLAGGMPVFSWLNPKDWSINFEDLTRRITKKTKAIIISNPNNPTGTVYPAEDLKKLAKLALEKELFIIADDPYRFLVYEGQYFSVSSIQEMKDLVISCFSFSKEYAMTGYRLGYAVAQVGILNNMMKVHDACNIRASSVSQEAGIIALDCNEDINKDIKDALAENRELICTGLSRIKGLEFVKPSGAYYVFVKYPGSMNSVDLALDMLRKVQVEVVPGSAFGPAGEGHIRLTFGGRPPAIKDGLSRLKNYFEA